MSDPARFVAAFAAYWAAPDLDVLPALLAPEVRLRQPLAEPTDGLAAARAGFERIFAALPDLRGEVDRWSAAGEYVFIEFRLRATLAGRPFEWPVVDRFTLRDGLAAERVSYFDPLPLVLAGLRRPSGWRQLWTAGGVRALLSARGTPR
jgi:ketosteroid isomerase-like protein